MDEGGSCGGAFDHGGDVSWKLFGSLECAIDALDLGSAGCELTGRLARLFAVGQRTAVADQHPPEDRGGTPLRLRVCASKADQAAGAVIPGRQRTEMGAHVAQIAPGRELGPLLRGRIA
jgi:hypothetical protein